MRDCQHDHPEWCCLAFDANHEDTALYFKSAANIDDIGGDDWSNPLMLMCIGARDSFDLPQGSVNESLYEILEEKPEIFMATITPSPGVSTCSLGAPIADAVVQCTSPSWNRRCTPLRLPTAQDNS